jgi:hypothetical protein
MEYITGLRASVKDENTTQAVANGVIAPHTAATECMFMLRPHNRVLS